MQPHLDLGAVAAQGEHALQARVGAGRREVGEGRLERGGIPAAIAGTSETTLKRLENVRSRAVTRERFFPRPWVSGPPTTAKCGITMLSFLAPVASTLSSTSAACERAAGGEESAPPSAASSDQRDQEAERTSGTHQLVHGITHSCVSRDEGRR